MEIDENGGVTLERRSTEQVKEYAIKQLKSSLILTKMSGCTEEDVQALCDEMIGWLFFEKKAV